MTAIPAIVHVVDDDASWRTSVARLLSAAGYRAALYESAERFLETADIDAPGCILLDLRMPGHTGLQLQQRLAQMRHALPIVFISGHGDIPTSVLAIKAGAEDFLTKPVATDVLLRAVEDAIARDRENRGRREQLDGLRSLVGALTPTERKVFDLVVRGKLNKQIAARARHDRAHDQVAPPQSDAKAEGSVARRTGVACRAPWPERHAPAPRPGIQVSRALSAPVSRQPTPARPSTYLHQRTVSRCVDTT